MIKIPKIHKLIAVDPGSNSAGFAYYKNEVLQESRQVNFKQKHSLYHRLYELSVSFQEFLRFKDDFTYYAIETPFIGRNPQVGIKIGQTRGVILGCIFKHIKNSTQIIDIAPQEIRGFYGLSPRAKKEDYQKIIKLSNANVGKMGEDEADAVAIGETGLWKIKNKLLLEKA